MAILKTKKQYKKDNGLKWLLHNELSTIEPPRPLDILHASDLTKEDKPFCPRYRAILLRDGDKRNSEKLGTSLNITYQMGRWYENQVRNVWLRNEVIGDWKCTSCDEITYEKQTAPDMDECHNCGASGVVAQYVEPRAYSPKYETSCGIDMFLWDGEMITPVEIKSLDKDYFRDLKAPMSEHRHRTKFYLDLLEHSTWMDYDVKINVEYAHILYVCKAFGFADDYEGRAGIDDAKFSPFKEYIVKRGEHKDMKGLYDKALQVKKYKKTGVLPKREVCTNYACKRAKWCEVKETCFSES